MSDTATSDPGASPPAGLRWRFGDFELDPRERRLWQAGAEVAVRPRAFDLLCTLVARAGQLVHKDELLDAVWPGLVVEENNIAAQVVALRRVIGNGAIATVPGRGYRFTAEVRALTAAQQGPADVTAHARHAGHAAPAVAASPAGRLFGRDEDLQRLQKALAAPGLLSLVGTAGVGKTALAQALRSHWPAAVTWVDLTAEEGAAQVAAALCRALGRPVPEGDPLPLLQRELAQPRRLLVLDNAEHLTDSVAALARALLAALPALHLLVTSQRPLGLAAERVHRLEPLALPPPEAPPAQALEFGAVALLVDRIRAADHRMQPGAQALPLLRALCAQLDGLPLALEMAAARVPLLGLRGVCDALAERFALLARHHRLATPRHRSLHAALDWSHGLLEPDEQRLFAALGVFCGGFSLELAVAVGAHDGADGADRWATIDRLATLVERSLVVVDPGEPPRYRLLETVRAYALERLAEGPDEAAARRRHALALAALFRGLEQGQRQGAGGPAQARARPEMENLRAALAWAHAHAPEQAVLMAVDASVVMPFSLWMPELCRWLGACEPLLAHVPLPVQACWWREYARLLMFTGHPRTTEAARHAVTLYRGLDDPRGLFWAQIALVRGQKSPSADLDELLAEIRAHAEGLPPGHLRERAIAASTEAMAHQVREDWGRALQARERELTLMRRLGDAAGVGAARSNIVNLLTLAGQPAAAVAEAHALLAELSADTPGNEAYARLFLVYALLALDRLDEALVEAPALLALARRLDMPQPAAAMALLVARQGRLNAAAQLLGFAVATYRRLGADPAATGDHIFVRARQLVDAALPAAVAQRLLAEGEALDAEAADRLLSASAGH